ncbi:MAG: hypothetical protein LBT47_12405, partial [Deltaproteobacteria bacterium]|nr:hypothetical protein [Deltaproteobacteria bacterium]
RHPNLLFEMLICCLLIFSALMAKDAHVYSGLKFGNFALAPKTALMPLVFKNFLGFKIILHC